MAVPGVLALSNSAPIGGISFSGVAPISGALLANPLAASVQQHAAAAAVQKLNQVRYVILTMFICRLQMRFVDQTPVSTFYCFGEGDL